MRNRIVARAGGRYVRTGLGSVVVACALTGAVIDRPHAQQRASDPARPVESGTREGQPARRTDPVRDAFNRGEYDEVDRLLAGRTDPDAVAVRARARMARGAYDEAERLLKPAAAAAPRSEAGLAWGELLLIRGARVEGRDAFRRVLDAAPRTPAEYVRSGRAAQFLGAFQDANARFREAHQLAPGDPDVNVAWGGLFLDAHDNQNAATSFREALAVEPGNVAAILGLARASADTNPPEARKGAEQALTIDARNVQAHILLAGLALDDRRHDDARRAIEAARAANPSALDARALDAAMAYLDGDTAAFTRKADEARAINPSSGEVFRVAGDHLARNYRFDEAVEMTQRAIAIDPDDTRAHADLGMHLLRTGDEPGARTALERAFKDDPFDVVTYNLLSMLDTLDTFVTVQSGTMTLRFHPDEAAVMREQVAPFAHEALDALGKAWNVTPQGPLLVEMFPTHDDFAVRTVGLPGMLGALGACFGRVVTLDSPHARPPGEYNWQPTLWHELAHVITLQLSNNRVPRWLTEGISQWEERRARPEWGREMEVSFAHALEQNEILPVRTLNEGFSDPQKISLAYYEASLLVDHLVGRFGQPALRALLQAYGRGLDTDAAVQESLGAGLADIQRSFDEYLSVAYAGLRTALRRPDLPKDPALADLQRLAREQPGSFPVQMALGTALAKAGNRDQGIAAFERAARLVPAAAGGSNPNTRIAALATEAGDTTRAIAALEAVVRVDHADVESARKLVALLLPTGDAVKLEDAYRRLADVDPFDAAAQTALGQFALKRNDASAAARAFRTALAANTPDRVSAHTNLAEAYLLGGNRAGARTEVLSALELAPSYERAQDLLLRLRD